MIFFSFSEEAGDGQMIFTSLPAYQALMRIYIYALTEISTDD
jgi:hypothetical protein